MLYLIRHAHAVDSEPDAERPLSDRGREEVRRLASFLRPSGQFRPEEIWRSPFVRAKETAAILAADLGWTVPAEIAPGLEPEDFPGRIAARLATTVRSVVIVGHEPHLTGLATLLVTGALNPPAFVFSKCATLALEPGHNRSPGSWMVRWMVTPQLLP